MKNFITSLFVFIFAISLQGQSNKVLDYTDLNFKTAVIEKKGISVIEFWAEWCGPCRMIDPILEELAADYDQKVNIGKINVDFETKVTKKYNIRSIPTILFFKDGEVIEKIVGVHSKEDLERKIEELL